MASSQEATPRDLLSLVLRSRKALDHTKTLCARADSLAKESTELSLDLVAEDAKVRWTTDLIIEQLKVEDARLLRRYSRATIDSSLAVLPNPWLGSAASWNKMPR